MKSYIFRFIESVRAHCDLPIVHLTDAKTQGLGDEQIRNDYGNPLNIMLNKVLHLRDYPCAEKVVLDTDILVKEPFDDVFDQGFDIAMHRRIARDTDNTYNGGVVFSRSQAFWDECAEVALSFDEKQHRWGADQRAENRLIMSGKYSVYDLPRKYNYCPSELKRGAFNKVPKEGIVIMHFKGPLKEFMHGISY